MTSDQRPDTAPAAGRPGATATLLFPAVVAVLYGLLYLLNPPRTGEAFVFGLKVAAKIGPVLLVVFVLIFLTNLLPAVQGGAGCLKTQTATLVGDKKPIRAP